MQAQPQPGAMQFGVRPMMPTNGMPQSGAMLGGREMLPQQPMQQQPQQPMQAQPMQNNLRARLGMLA
jgi:hypothetical protein